MKKGCGGIIGDGGGERRSRGGSRFSDGRLDKSMLCDLSSFQIVVLSAGGCAAVRWQCKSQVCSCIIIVYEGVTNYFDEVRSACGGNVSLDPRGREGTKSKTVAQR